MQRLRLPLLAAIAALFLSTALQAQQVKYSIQRDAAEIDPIVILNLELLQIDMGIRNLDGASFNSGVWGIVEPVRGIGAQFDFKRSWFALGRLGFKDYPSNTDLSVGGYYVFARKVRDGKPTKVVLDTEIVGESYSTNAMGDRVKTTTESVTTLTVPAQNYKAFYVRGGLYHKSGPYAVKDALDIEDLDFYEYAGIRSTGLYAGVGLRSVRNIFIDTDLYGEQFNSSAHDWFVDVLVAPSQFDNLDPERQDPADLTDIVKQQSDLGGLGFRVGWWIYQIEEKQYTDKTFGLSGTYSVGYHPYQGIFFSGGIGLTLLKKSRKAK
jgi:hypothetical protein